MDILSRQRLAAPYPSLGYAAWVIGVLFLVTLFSQLDRQLPALLVRPIRDHFQISDTAFSLLQGYAFSICYTLTGLPLGRLVDRAVRRNLIFWGLLFWSLMTALSGLADSYTVLFLARMGVGVGEAVLAPAAYSIIADYVAPERRGRALAFYYTSLAVGSGASMLLGGWLLGAIPPQGMALPLLGTMPAWRICFLAAAAPGILLGALLFSIREPVRREQGVQAERCSVAAFARFLGQHRATFGRLLTYPALLAVIGYGMLSWAPALFDRRFHMPASRAGIVLGVIIAVAGLGGTLLGGYLSDRWLRLRVPAARFRVALAGTVVCAPTAVLWPLAGDAGTAFALLGCAVFGLSISQSAAPACIQEVCPNNMRGQAVSVYLLVAGLLGIGLGPTLVALVSDHILRDDGKLHWAISATVLPTALAAIWLCWSGLRPFEATRSLVRGHE
ncbi:spinster family MFS transporter [Pseudoduganella umbonata]|uniref:MFS family permease n=1 Tax=Pseudoduganella umbonata TaxID=864828 RepID=A0A4P8HNQ0_9BURK|nr:MFS transporter [Pseudoduganella umbonata]MBB3219952.1 MFS family permease [Pseudoduganella umbonata]QCP09965.1 MFS transporter [Pseudoduganella umbonata]